MTEHEQQMLTDIRQRLEKVEHFSFGNGKPGADERLRNIESTQATQGAALTRVEVGVNTLVEDNAAKTNQWLGAKRTIVGAAILVSIITGGSAMWLSERLGDLMKVLP